jgi:tetratricopeptide (TPR) repeat protein
MTRKSAISPSQKTKLFLSYSRKDIKMAERLHVGLEDQGFEVLLDRTDIAPGEDWKARLGQLIHEADAVVFTLSPNSTASAVCGWEVEEAARLGKRILPALIHKVIDSEVPPTLGRLNFISFLKREFDDGIADLVAALNTNLEWVREHTRISELALGWDKKGRNAEQILRGAALLDAERWIATPQDDAASPTELQRSFIAASRAAATGRQRNWVIGSIGVAVISAGLAVWGEVNRKEAVAQRASAVEQRDRAEKVLKAATATSHGLVFDLAQKFRNLEGVPLGTVKSLLDKSRELQAELGKAGDITPEMRRDEAGALNELAITYQAQGATPEAVTAATEALSIVQSIANADPKNNKWQRDVAFIQMTMADILELQGKPDQALALFKKSNATLNELLAQDPSNKDWLSAQTVSLDRLGNHVMADSNYAQALEYYREAKNVRQTLATLEPKNDDWKLALAISHTQIGRVLEYINNHGEAYPEFQKAMALIDELISRNPNNQDYKRNRFGIGFEYADNLRSRGDREGAIKVYNESMSYAVKLTNSDHNNLQWLRDYAFSLFKAGSYQLELDGIPQAESFLKDGLEQYAILINKDPKNLAWLQEQSEVQLMWGDLLVKKGLGKDALSSYQQAVSTIRTLSKDPAQALKLRATLIRYLNQMASVLSSLGNFEKVIEVQTECIKLNRERLLGMPEDLLVQSSLSASLIILGDSQLATGDLKAGEQNYREALNFFQKLHSAKPQDAEFNLNVAIGLSKIGDVKYALADGPAAYDYYEKSRIYLADLLSKDSSNLAVALNLAIVGSNLGLLLYKTNNNAPAIERLHAALSIIDELVRVAPDNFEYLRLQIIIYQRLGNAGETPKINYEKAIALTEAIKSKGTQLEFAESVIASLKGELARLP